MNAVIPFQHPQSKAQFAKRYAQRGYLIFPCWWLLDEKDERGHLCACGNANCNSRGKHPISRLAPLGHQSASNSVDVADKWWSSYPDANIGLPMAKNNLIGVDIDPRNGGFMTIEDIEAKRGPLESSVLQFTGGGGEHRVFSVSDGLQFPGTLGPGIDLKHNGYLIVEPSNHVSGGRYGWEASSSILDESPSPLPDWVRDIGGDRQPVAQIAQNDHVTSWNDGEYAAVRTGLELIPADDRDHWLSVGMACNQHFGAAGFDLWDEWSRKSAKYDYNDSCRVWRSFKAKGLDGISKGSIFKLVTDLTGIVVRNPVFVPEQSDTADVSLYQINEQPQNNVRCPGVLGIIQDYYNATAKISQPGFAVQCALGIGSVALGRAFRTEYGNYTSLWFMNIVGSARGKEHIKTTTETVLDACGLSHLISGDGYTSQGAVISALMDAPAHISVIDEIGRYLAATKERGNVNGQAANTAMMEAISRCGGVLRSKNYSRMSAGSKADVVMIRRPAMTIQAMTTPSTFYDNLTVDQVADGFLGRFIIFHSRLPRVAPRRVPFVDVPEQIRNWADSIRARISAHDPLNTLAGHENPIEAITLKFRDSASRMHDEFAREMVALMNELDQFRLAEIAGRQAEFAMRLACICALARDPLTETIENQDSQFAIDYIRSLALETVEEIRQHLNGSEFEKNKKIILEAIRKAGANGVTEREMHRVQPFTAFKERDIGEMLQSLTKAADIAFVNVREGKPGCKRMAFVAVQRNDDEEE